MDATNAIVPRSSQPWVGSLALFSVTTVVEALGVSQVFAFMPIYLKEMGVPAQAVPHWVGVISSLTFVLGLPLVPLWGVWADKYSRKAIIIRSALVEALVFALVALSRQPWQLAGSLMLVGFQLGNTGVMLAAIRDLTPKKRLGTAIALFGASSPVGFAVGPALGGLMIDRLHTSMPTVYAFSAALSVATAVMLAGFRLLLADGRALVSTRMYASLREIWQGWSKNMCTADTGQSRPMRLAMYALYGLLSVAPFVVLLWSAAAFIAAPDTLAAVARLQSAA